MASQRDTLKCSIKLVGTDFGDDYTEAGNYSYRGCSRFVLCLNQNIFITAMVSLI